MYISDLSIELAKLESTESVDSAQAAATTSYEDWCNITRAENRLSGLFSLGRAQKEKLENERRLKNQTAFEKYHKQGEPRGIDYQTDLIQICQI